jgi:DNA-binding SARP family transcriptional activator/predicted ATPase
MEFRILGTLEVRDGDRVVDLGGPKPRALLAILLLRAGEVVSSDQAIEELWGEAPPRSAAHLLHVYVSSLRKALEPGGGAGSPAVLVTRAPGYSLDLNGDELDSHRFERLHVEGGRLIASGELERASDVLRQALAEWRGPALADFAYEPFGQAEIARLEELRLVALEERIDADLGLGRDSDVVGELAAFLAEFPHRERARGQLMLALYRSGRQAEALEVYREGRQVLAEGFGLEPSPALQRLQQAILRQDAELELVRDLERPTAAQAARKQVTAVLAGLACSGGLDPEARRRAVVQAVDTSASVLTRHGAAVQELVGDSILAVFGFPTLHEDEAERAVRCALELRQALVGGEVDVRIGINTGQAEAGGPELLDQGDVMNAAALLRTVAAPGQILVGRETMMLTSHVVEYSAEVRIAAQGAGEPLRACAALQLLPERRRVRSPLVGRERELELLAGALERATARREPQVVLVLGEPGIGKSRLAEEFAARASGRVGVFRGACLAYGEGSTWLPLAEVVRQEAGIGGADTDEQALVKLNCALRTRHGGEELPLIEAQLAPLVGASGAAVASGQELLWGFRRYLEELASAHPAAIVLDDLHWGGETLLETIQELIQMIAPVPLAIILQGRPELRERLAELLADERTSVISLGALSDKEATVLVDTLMEVLATAWADGVRQSIVERAGGNPLFLEEVAAMAGEEEIEAGIPHSLRALITARLDLLPPGAKRAAQAAAVVGDRFWEGAVAALDDGQIPTSALRRLRTRGFVEEETESAFLGQRQFRFHHALIREATYDSVPQVERSELHRRAAAWLGERAGDRAELIVPIARHLEQAITPLEATAPALVEAAVRALGDAAAWTAANASVPEAIALLRRAAAVAEGTPELSQLARAKLAAMLARSGSVAEAVELAEDALAGAATPEGTALASVALAEVARSRGDGPAIREAGERALEIARSMGLLELEIEILDLIGLADFWSGRLFAAGESHRRAAELALELGDLPRAAWNLGGFSAVCLLDTGQIVEAERQTAEAMRLATQSGSLRALESAHAGLGHLRRVQDRLEEAVEHGRERLGLVEKLGEQLWLAGCLTFSLARPLVYLGRLEEAWECLERALKVSAEMGGSAFDREIRAARVGVLLAWERADEATIEAKAIEPVTAYPQIAELRAAQGRHDEADAIWLQILDGSDGSDNRLERAETMVGYVRFLAARGRTDAARATLAEAQGLVEGTGAKYHERLIREAQALIEKVPASPARY